MPYADSLLRLPEKLLHQLLSRVPPLRFEVQPVHNLRQQEHLQRGEPVVLAGQLRAGHGGENDHEHGGVGLILLSNILEPMKFINNNQIILPSAWRVLRRALLHRK